MRVLLRVNTDFPGARTLAGQLAADGLPAGARIIYSSRNKVAVIDDGAEGPLCVKAFGVPGIIKGIIYGLFRKPKALKAFDNAEQLRALGFDTPEPVCAVTLSECGCLRRSYYVCRYLENWCELRGIENLADFTPLVRALAAYMNRLHRAGVFMRDFTQGNILFRRDDSGAYRFMLVDINRMEFGVTDTKKLMSNFGAALDTRDGIVALAHAYAALQPESERDTVEALAVDTFDRRQAVLWRRRHIKEFLRGKK